MNNFQKQGNNLTKDKKQGGAYEKRKKRED